MAQRPAAPPRRRHATLFPIHRHIAPRQRCVGQQSLCHAGGVEFSSGRMAAVRPHHLRPMAETAGLPIARAVVVFGLLLPRRLRAGCGAGVRLCRAALFRRAGQRKRRRAHLGGRPEPHCRKTQAVHRLTGIGRFPRYRRIRIAAACQRAGRRIVRGRAGRCGERASAPHAKWQNTFDTREKRDLRHAAGGGETGAAPCRTIRFRRAKPIAAKRTVAGRQFCVAPFPQ